MRVVAARVHLPGVPALVLPLHGLLKQHTGEGKKQGAGTSSVTSAVPKPGTKERQLAVSSFQKKWHLARNHRRADRRARMSGQTANGASATVRKGLAVEVFSVVKT